MAVTQFLVEVALAPLLHIDGEHARIDQRSVEGRGAVGMAGGVGEPSGQIAPDLARHCIRVRRMHVGVEHQRPVEQLPVAMHEGEDAVPVERGAAGTNEVDDVGTVKTLAKGNEALGGEGLFSGEDAAGDAEHNLLRAAVDPGGIDSEAGVADTGDEVDEVVAAAALASQTGSSTEVVKPIARRRRKASGTSRGLRKKSRSLVERQMPVWWWMAKAPPMTKGTDLRSDVSSARIASR